MIWKLLKKDYRITCKFLKLAKSAIENNADYVALVLLIHENKKS